VLSELLLRLLWCAIFSLFSFLLLIFSFLGVQLKQALRAMLLINLTRGTNNMSKELTKDEMVAAYKAMKEAQKKRNLNSREKQKEMGIKTLTVRVKETDLNAVLNYCNQPNLQAFLNDYIIKVLDEIKSLKATQQLQTKQQSVTSISTNNSSGLSHTITHNFLSQKWHHFMIKHC
jgi:hypothetical protein